MCLNTEISVRAQDTDVVIFHNGDYLYGSTRVLEPTGVVEIDDGMGMVRTFKKSMVRQIYQGLQKPAAGQLVNASTPVQSSINFLNAARNEAVSAELPTLPAQADVDDITGGVNQPTRIKNGHGIEIEVDAESCCEVTHLRLTPVSYPFYNRRGSYLTARIRNLMNKTWEGLTFRIFVYDAGERLLATRDFYVFRLPPAAPDGQTPARAVEVDLADVSPELIRKIRFVRRY